MASFFAYLATGQSVRLQGGGSKDIRSMAKPVHLSSPKNKILVDTEPLWKRWRHGARLWAFLKPVRVPLLAVVAQAIVFVCLALSVAISTRECLGKL
jgi:hypothetical protein